MVASVLCSSPSPMVRSVCSIPATSSTVGDPFGVGALRLLRDDHGARRGRANTAARSAIAPSPTTMSYERAPRSTRDARHGTRSAVVGETREHRVDDRGLAETGGVDGGVGRGLVGRFAAGDTRRSSVPAGSPLNNGRPASVADPLRELRRRAPATRRRSRRRACAFGSRDRARRRRPSRSRSVRAPRTHRRSRRLRARGTRARRRGRTPPRPGAPATEATTSSVSTNGRSSRVAQPCADRRLSGAHHPDQHEVPLPPAHDSLTVAR